MFYENTAAIINFYAFPKLAGIHWAVRRLPDDSEVLGPTDHAFRPLCILTGNI
jgi:hypothetical protein